MDVVSRKKKRKKKTNTNTTTAHSFLNSNSNNTDYNCEQYAFMRYLQNNVQLRCQLV